MSNLPPLSGLERSRLHLASLRRVIHHLSNPDWTKDPAIIAAEAREGMARIREVLRERDNAAEEQGQMKQELESLRAQVQALGGQIPSSQPARRI